MTSFGAELHRAAEMGWSVDKSLTECMNRNWQGFKASWLRDDPPRVQSSNGDSHATPSRLSAAERVLANALDGERADAGRSDAAAHGRPHVVGAHG